MSHPMIASGDPLVDDLLAGTIELIREAGGYVAPSTIIIERAGQLSIESSALDGDTLLRIPRAAFIRVDRVTFSLDHDRIVIAQVPEDCGELEWELLYLQVALHNACDKVNWMRRTHPSLDPGLPVDLIEAVRRVVPSFRSPQMDAIDLLWANRCFRIPMTDQAASERVLIPLVDLLNHHAEGAVGDWDGEAFEISARLPFGTAQCALDYGMDRDPLEMAIVYGFIDPSTEITAGRGYDIDALKRIIDLASTADAPESAEPLRGSAARIVHELESRA
jgi:hypothetical protein